MRADSLSSTFSALADPTRRAILAQLAEGDAIVGDLAEPFDMTLPSVSRHLKVLEDAGLITREKDAQRRICHLQAEQLKKASDWIAHYRAFWETQFDSLARYVDDLNAQSED